MSEGLRVQSKSALERLVDASAALSSGKLPSQTQITRLLQVLLNSDLLTPSQGPKVDDSPLSRAVMQGTGPTSLRGMKVLSDVRDVIQAVVQFGLEKNGTPSLGDCPWRMLLTLGVDDDKVQELLYHLSQIEAPVDALRHAVPELPRVRVDASTIAEGSKEALQQGKDLTEDVKDTSKVLPSHVERGAHLRRSPNLR